MLSKNTFEISGDTVWIRKPGEDWVAQCTYCENYWEELTSHTWSLHNGYPFNKALGGGLHQYMMKKWYGEKAYQEFKEKKYVIDHMNNRHTDCRISNLEYVRSRVNTGKGMWIDSDIKDISPHIGITVFKDYQTGLYQVTVAGNDVLEWHDDDGTQFIPSSIKFLYEGGTDRYETVINDVEGIILNYRTREMIEPEKTNAACIRIYKALFLCLSVETKGTLQKRKKEKGNLPVAFMTTIHYDENWIIPSNYDGCHKIYEIMNP